MKLYESVVRVCGRVTRWTKCFIPGTVFDNKVLIENDPMYVRRLWELPEKEREALLFGNWDVFSGQFFPEFTDAHICDDFEVPLDWPVWVAMDWGYATKCAVLFFTQDPGDGMVYCFDEIYVTKQGVAVVAEQINGKMEGRGL